jgi:hypothetical protein
MYQVADRPTSSVKTRGRAFWSPTDENDTKSGELLIHFFETELNRLKIDSFLSNQRYIVLIVLPTSINDHEHCGTPRYDSDV